MKFNSRRDFFKSLAALGLITTATYAKGLEKKLEHEEITKKDKNTQDEIMMNFKLMELPFEKTALEPYISAKTIEYHYGKHHASYINNLNTLSKGTKYETMQLEDIIRTADGAIFNNAAQVFNHDFYWRGMTPDSSNISTELSKSIKRDFESIEKFKETFLKSAATLFGSGWTWLSVQDNGTLVIEQTSNADTPIRHGRTPLLTCDVWEHSYYIDYHNARLEYLENWWKLINWNFVSDNLTFLKTTKS
jgi:Fe-Mn family superoxide dismutase